MAVRIPLGQIKDVQNEFDLRVGPEEIGLVSGIAKDLLDIHVEVQKISNQLNMTVYLKGIMKLECDRCLEQFDRKFENKFELVYIVSAGDAKIEEDDYVKVYTPHMRYIDITKDLKDYVELSVPMRKVPEEKEDGSCSWCSKGADHWSSFIVNKEDAEEI